VTEFGIFIDPLSPALLAKELGKLVLPAVITTDVKPLD
jgi:hypothetical protein